jgi:hypothetical protein
VLKFKFTTNVAALVTIQQFSWRTVYEKTFFTECVLRLMSPKGRKKFLEKIRTKERNSSHHKAAWSINAYEKDARFKNSLL